MTAPRASAAPGALAPAPIRSVRLAEIVGALSHALDLAEGQPMGHAARCCRMGMRLAEDIGVPAGDRPALYYGLLLKDLGCSSNAAALYEMFRSDDRAAKRDARHVDFDRTPEALGYLRRHLLPDLPAHRRLRGLIEHVFQARERKRLLVRMRCERGAGILERMGFPAAAAEAIAGLDERWDGEGHPLGLKGEAIPLAGRIAGLCQTLEFFSAEHGPEAARDAIRRRAGSWFDPRLAEAVLRWGPDDPVWAPVDLATAVAEAAALDPAERPEPVDDARFDAICEAFAEVIDAKSPFTARHSAGVAAAALGMAREMNFGAAIRLKLRRAALLHDIGKLAVPNTILEKPGPLTASEWATMKAHPRYTLEILERAPILREFAAMAAAHHEKLDGTGYHLGLGADDLSLPARVLAVADIYDALTADRPYRKGMPVEQALDIISKDVPAKLDPDCFEALREACRGFDDTNSAV